MSRISVEGRFKEHPVPLVIGWDRPLQHCFLQFDLDDEQVESDEFAPLVAVATEIMFQPLDCTDIENSLSRAGVSVPGAALTELRLHMDCNAGNVFVRFAADGQRVVSG